MLPLHQLHWLQSAGATEEHTARSREMIEALQGYLLDPNTSLCICVDVSLPRWDCVSDIIMCHPISQGVHITTEPLLIQPKFVQDICLPKPKRRPLGNREGPITRSRLESCIISEIVFCACHCSKICDLQHCWSVLARRTTHLSSYQQANDLRLHISLARCWLSLPLSVCKAGESMAVRIHSEVF